MTMAFFAGCFILFVIIMVAAHALKPDDEMARWRRERERMNHRPKSDA